MWRISLDIGLLSEIFQLKDRYCYMDVRLDQTFMKVQRKQ